jgi:D-xylose transport system permease protein
MNAKLLLKTFSMPIALAGIWLFFIWKIDHDAIFGDGHGGYGRLIFLGPRNLSFLMIEFSIIGTLALGMFMILLTGQIDLSAGSGVGLIGGITAVLIIEHHWSAPLALLAAFATALLLWTLMGTLIVKERIPSFIITLGGMLIFRGLFWLVIHDSTIPVKAVGDNLFAQISTYYLPANAGWILAGAVAVVLGVLQARSRSARSAHQLPVPSLGRAALRLILAVAAILVVVDRFNRFKGLPMTFLILAATATAVYFLTKHTPFGRYLYAIGGNEEAAVLSGINVDRVLIGVYVLMGATVAMTGFMQTAYQGSSSTTVGDLMELDAIAACVIGGTALKGGRGTVWGVLFGTLIMTSLLNGMDLMAVTPEMKYVARGTVLALAVWLDVRLGRA